MKSRFKSKQSKKTHRTLSELDFINLWSYVEKQQNMRKSKEEGEKMRERVELLSNSVQQQKDEICQLSTLYKTERDATLALQKALSSEKENFNR